MLIAVGEPSGAIEVEQHILPPRHDKRAGYHPRQVRALDVATRHYTRKEPLGDDNLRDLLNGKWLDPLLGALAGYALIRAGAADRFIGRPSGGTRVQPSALANMLNFFGDLPDSHVLAALCRPEQREEHFSRALELGLPVFAEGFRRLYSWHRESGNRVRPLWLEPSALLSGSIWTAWAAERPAIRVENGSFGEPPPGWAMLEDKRELIQRALPAIGAVRVAGDPIPHRTTAFAVAPGLVATMEYAWPTDPPPDSEDAPVVAIDFGAGPESGGPRFPVIERVAVIELANEWASSALVLLRTADRAEDGTPFPAPLRLAAQPPDAIEGRRVAVIGFPGEDGRIPPQVRERVFGGTFWVKRIQPGRALSLAEDGSVLRHDCMTAGGNGGVARCSTSRPARSSRCTTAGSGRSTSAATRCRSGRCSTALRRPARRPAAGPDARAARRLLCSAPCPTAAPMSLDAAATCCSPRSPRSSSGSSSARVSGGGGDARAAARGRGRGCRAAPGSRARRPSTG